MVVYTQHYVFLNFTFTEHVLQFNAFCYYITLPSTGATQFIKAFLSMWILGYHFKPPYTSLHIGYMQEFLFTFYVPLFWGTEAVKSPYNSMYFIHASGCVSCIQLTNTRCNAIHVDTFHTSCWTSKVHRDMDGPQPPGTLVHQSALNKQSVYYHSWK